MAKFVSSLKAKLIYVFRINDMSHAGCLKVGEATLTDEENLWGLSPSSHLLNVAAKKRINQYTQTAGITYDLLYTELSIFTRGGAIMSLTDGEVHKVLSVPVSKRRFLILRIKPMSGLLRTWKLSRMLSMLLKKEECPFLRQRLVQTVVQ